MKRDDGFSRIESSDALLIAAVATTTIVKRANCGGTKAVTYDGVRDAILDAMAPFMVAEPVKRSVSSKRPAA